VSVAATPPAFAPEAAQAHLVPQRRHVLPCATPRHAAGALCPLNFDIRCTDFERLHLAGAVLCLACSPLPPSPTLSCHCSDFDPFSVVVLVFAVIHANAVTNDARSNWLMGVQLIATYLLIGLTFLYK